MSSARHVLIVEDDRPLRKLLCRQLMVLGYRVDVASDGNEGLSRWESGEYDLVITDLNMPGMGGMELASRIRASRHRMAQSVPIVAISGQDGPTGRAAEVVTDCIGKPFSTPDLERVLDRLLPVAAGNSQEGGTRAGGRVGTSPQFDVDEAVSVVVPRDPMDDSVIMRSIASTFIETIPEYLQTLREACAAGSRSGIVQAVHKLKSAARLVGGDEVADLCEAVEGAARNSGTAEILKESEAIPDAVRALERFLNLSLASRG